MKLELRALLSEKAPVLVVAPKLKLATLLTVVEKVAPLWLGTEMVCAGLKLIDPGPCEVLTGLIITEPEKLAFGLTLTVKGDVVNCTACTCDTPKLSV